MKMENCPSDTLKHTEKSTCHIKTHKSQGEKQVIEQDLEYHPNFVKLNTWENAQQNINSGYCRIIEL